MEENRGGRSSSLLVCLSHCLNSNPFSHLFGTSSALLTATLMHGIIHTLHGTVSVWCYASTMVSSTIMWYNAMSHTMVAFINTLWFFFLWHKAMSHTMLKSNFCWCIASYRTHSIDLHACYTVLHCTIVSCTPVPIHSTLHALIVDLHTC